MQYYLKHYASPYYDPVKAHEYYMRTRQLKGRTKSLSGLNDSGKEASEYVKSRINEEKQSKLNSETQSYQTSIKNYTAQIKKRLSVLRFNLSKKNLSPEEKYAIKQEIQQMIENNNKKRQELAKNYKTKVQEINSDYENRYSAELEKMLATPGFLKTKKASKSTSKGKTIVSNMLNSTSTTNKKSATYTKKKQTVTNSNKRYNLFDLL